MVLETLVYSPLNLLTRLVARALEECKATTVASNLHRHQHISAASHADAVLDFVFGR